MAGHKDIRKTTPSYTIVIRDDDEAVVDPTTFDEIKVLVYNMASGIMVEQFIYPAAADYTTLIPTSVDVPFTFTAQNTEDAESGENRIEVWTTKDSDVSCMTGILNEFIDSKDA
jgi:hypothetical protein